MLQGTRFAMSRACGDGRCDHERKGASMRWVVLLCAVAALAGAVDDVAAEDEDPGAVANPVVFWELGCHDAEKSVEFFSKLFGWDFSKPEGSLLYTADTAMEQGGINGGIFTLRKARLPFVTIYVQVEEIEKKAKLVEELGGLIIEEPQDIGGGMWICLFTDPSGVTFAMLEPGRAQEAEASDGGPTEEQSADSD